MNQDNDNTLHEGKTFTDINYADKILRKREFVNCEFIKCDFSKSDLSENDFVDCRFVQCNFSMTIINKTGFKDVNFIGCKLLGVDFSKCSKFMFSFRFEHCHINYCTFYGTKLRKTKFTDCALKETDFEEADLTAAIFHNCDLSGATFVRSILEKTDFRTAKNFGLDPEINRMKQAKFSNSGLSGLLLKYNLDIDYHA